MVEVSKSGVSPRRHVADFVYEAASRAASSRTVESHIEDLPALSLYAFATSIMTLGSRITKMGRLELGIAEVISWQRPALTLTMLCGYTLLCYHPQWIAVLPLLYFLLFIMVPNYAEKYFIENEVDKRIIAGTGTPSSTSSGNTFGGSNSSSNIEGVVGEVPTVSNMNQTNKEEEEEEKKKKQLETKGMLVAIRQGQKTLQSIVRILDKIDEFRNGPAKFSDPQISCLILAGSAILLLLTSYTLTYISIPFFFSFVGWALVGSKHPLAKLTTEKIEELHIEPSIDFAVLKQKIEAFCRSRVLVDDPPLCRDVEIFELEPQGLTARQWNSEGTLYTQDPYIPGTGARVHKQSAHGVDNLSDVIPPRGWYFDLGDNWKPDLQPELWISKHKLEEKLYQRKVYTDGSWVQDATLEEEGDAIVWRRRRLTRKCYYDY